MNSINIIVLSVCITSIIISAYHFGRLKTVRKFLEILDPENLLPTIHKLAANKDEEAKMMMLICRIIDEMGEK